MALVVDDHLLIDLLAGPDRGWLGQEARRSAVYTTAGWYYRLASAIAPATGRGALNSRLDALAERDQENVRSQLAALPDAIGLIGPRTLVPVMASLRTPRRLNYLGRRGVGPCPPDRVNHRRAH